MIQRFLDYLDYHILYNYSPFFLHGSDFLRTFARDTPSIHWHPDTVVFLLINTVVASFFQDVAQMSKTIIYEFINKKIICIIDYWCDISTAGDSKWVTGN